MLDAEPGTYVLLVRAPAEGQVQVGELGTLDLAGDWYAYVGSAFGPGGLRARVGRHLSGRGALHWHIDYLVRATEVAEVWFSSHERKREEEWVAALRSAPGSTNPLRGFGSGDCGCEGHLFRFASRPTAEDFRGWLEARVPAAESVRVLTPDAEDPGTGSGRAHEKG